MKVWKLLIAVYFVLAGISVGAQQHNKRFERIDIQHYKFEIHLNDTTNRIEAKAQLEVLFLKPANQLELDLVQKNSKGNGMQVRSVQNNNQHLKFNQTNNQLIIHFETQKNKGEQVDILISYSGIPEDGLIISKNSHGQRTFFGDNWPDRARHWLPTVDHPSDKATVEFLIYAPQHYEVVANGLLCEKKELNNIEFTHWKEEAPISTKIMVIGVADFAIGNQSKSGGIPVSSWIFKNDSITGFKNYRFGAKALSFYSDLIGPYPYEKLAHIQSKTRYGGMENASCIFYHERTATCINNNESLFAHEVAHQWFGDAVTEQNWHHVWLSEGFATYLTHVYNQHFYGDSVFRERLKADRKRVISYSKQNFEPIIDTTVTNYIQLLNTNTYQKASWILHMLRCNLGDPLFFKGLREYYSQFKNSSVLSSDFKKVMEKVSGKKLDTFFNQWLWQPGHPVIDVSWEQKNNKLEITVLQKQKNSFIFPFEILIQTKNNPTEIHQFKISERNSVFSLIINSEVENIVPDPNTKLLFETESKNGNIQKR